jgi:hypothetical protein
MHIFLFLIYGIVICYLLQRMRFFRDSGIKPSVLVWLFVLRVATGCLHNSIAWRYYPNHGDIWAYFKASFITRHELLHDLPGFIADNSTWAYLPYNIIIFLHTIFNFLSGDNMYINTLFFSFGVFAGSIAMFRAFKGFFRNDLLCAACTLLIPSTLYWTACIHKEGLLYLSMGFFFFHLQRAIAGGWKVKKVLLCLVFFSLTAFFRAAIAVSLLPGLFLWALIGGSGFRNSARRDFNSPGSRSRDMAPSSGARSFFRNPLRLTLTLILAVIIIMVFVKPALFSGIPAYVSTQQSEFQAFQGHSRLYLPQLEPTGESFLHVLPRAALNGFCEPLPGAGGQPIYLVFSIELLLVWAIVILALFSLLRPAAGLPRPAHAPQFPGPPDSSLPPSPGFPLCCLVFALTGLLLIGYTIPFAGAIIRYRSLYLPFLLAPFVHLLQRQPLFRRVNDRLGRMVFFSP